MVVAGVVGREMGDVPDCSEEGAVTFFLQGFDSFVWEGGSGAFEAVEAGV